MLWIAFRNANSKYLEEFVSPNFYASLVCAPKLNSLSKQIKSSKHGFNIFSHNHTLPSIFPILIAPVYTWKSSLTLPSHFLYVSGYQILKVLLKSLQISLQLLPLPTLLATALILTWVTSTALKSVLVTSCFVSF